MRSKLLLALCALGVLGGEHVAAAYPSSVAFAPTGTVYKEGELSSFAVVVRDLNPAGPWQTWTGAQLGLWRGFDTGAGTGLAVEAGTDLAVRFGGAGSLTPLFNAKIALFDERGYRPALALGFYQLSPVAASSAKLLYLSSTKSVQAGRIPLGQITLGALASVASDGRTTDCSDRCAFRGSFPVVDSRYGFLAGWSSPSLGPARLALDVVTGTSLASGANAVLAFDIGDHLHPFAGVSLAVDRRRELGPSDAVFVGLSVSAKLFSFGRGEQDLARTGAAR